METNAAPLPILYLPLVWVGVAGTFLSYEALARAHVDLTRVLTSLHIRNQFTFAICLYGLWTLAAALLLVYFLRRTGVTGAAVGLKGELSLAAAILAVGGALLGIALWPILQRITPAAGTSVLFRQLPGGQRRSNAFSPWDFTLLTAFGVIAVPALEELIFRGYVLTAIQEHARSPSGAVILTSLIFASVHVAFGGSVIVYAFFSSLLLSAVFLISQSLYPVILMHSLINLWGFVVGPMLVQAQSKAST